MLSLGLKQTAKVLSACLLYVFLFSVPLGCGGSGGGGSSGNGGAGGSSPAALVAKTYGTTGYDSPYSIQQTADGGYIVIGWTQHSGTNTDILILKLDDSGYVTWQKYFGGVSWEWGKSIQQTTDGGYIVAGGIASSGAGNVDIWVLKLDAAGSIVWQKSYGGINADDAFSIQQTSDGGYIVAGTTDSFGAGERDAYVLKLDASGNVIWQKAYGGVKWDEATYVRQTADGGYIVAGWTVSFGTMNINGVYTRDFWVLKLDQSGNVTWQKSYGGVQDDMAYSIQQTADSGYIVAGYGNFGASAIGTWILKLDASGNVVWQKLYGGSLSLAGFLQQTSDGGYIVAQDTAAGAGNGDIWVLKLDASGNVIWQKSYGGIDYDRAYSIQQTADGGYIVLAETLSFGAGYTDLWVLKLDQNGILTFNPSVGASTSNTSVIPLDTTIAPSDTTASALDIVSSVADTYVSPVNTSVIVQAQ